MPKLLFLKGLPASGKSTFAKELVKHKPNGWKRVCKDNLRAMIDESQHTKGAEKNIVDIHKMIVKHYLSAGYNVVADNTHFHKPYEDEYRALAKELDCQFEVKFFDVPLDVCIERDKHRENSVGEEVIRRTHNQYLKNEHVFDVKNVDRYIEHNDSLEGVVLSDLDGSLCLMKDRSPYDTEKVIEDLPHKPVVDLVNLLHETGKKIIFVSGRKEAARAKTLEWFDKHLDFSVRSSDLLMRSDDDNRSDDIIKLELYRKHIEGKFNVDFILDDRTKLVNAWRKEAKLPCFQVWYGDF